MDDVQPTPDQLAALLGFTGDELALNRMGKFSDRQRQTLFFMSVGYLARGLVLIMSTIIMAAVVADTVHTTVQRAGLVLLGLLIIGISGLWLHTARQIVFPHVETVIGPLRRGHDAWHPSIWAGNTELRISYRRWKRLKESYPGLYRFYVAPSLILLSVEPLKEHTAE